MPHSKQPVLIATSLPAWPGEVTRVGGPILTTGAVDGGPSAQQRGVAVPDSKPHAGLDVSPRRTRAGVAVGTGSDVRAQPGEPLSRYAGLGNVSDDQHRPGLGEILRMGVANRGRTLGQDREGVQAVGEPRDRGVARVAMAQVLMNLLCSPELLRPAEQSPDARHVDQEKQRGEGASRWERNC